MPESLGTIELLARELGRAFQPLRTRLAGGDAINLLAELGLRFPPQLAANSQFTAALASGANAASDLPALILDLIASAEAENVQQILHDAQQIIAKVETLISAIDTIGTTLHDVGPALPGMIAAEVQDFATHLPTMLLDYVVSTYLESYYPTVYNTLALIGIAERTPQAGGGDAAHPPFLQRRINLGQISSLLQSPQDVVRTIYGWGDDAVFTGALLLTRVHQFLASLAVPAILRPPSGPDPITLELLIFKLRPKTDIAPKGLELILDFRFPAAFRVSIPFFQPGWTLEAAADVEFDTALSAIIQPPLSVNIVPPAATTLQGDTHLALRGASPTAGQPFRVFGKQDGTRFEATSISAGVFGTVHMDGAAVKGDFGVEGKIEAGSVVIDLSEGDGFLTSILPPDGFRFNFDFGVGYSGPRGLYFSGSGGLETALSLHASIGPVNLDTLYLGTHVSGGGIDLEVSIAGSAELGPVSASVDRLGAIAHLKFQRGNLGPVDLSIDFKPPNGIGLSVDAGVVTGGGYLYIDTDRGEYAGALTLSIADFLTLNAVGLITTRMPDGSSGFSLLIIITAEFGTGIQLGFGFVLLGVGGLVGLNRTMQLQPLMDGVRSGAVNRIMFPHDVVANAPQIISDLRNFFPPQNGIFLIGPMAKLGWGTPALVTVALGVIIEIPGNIAILGVLRIALPTEDEALINLQVNFAGAIEFDKKRIYFFAALFDSRVVFLTIEGEMGLLVAYGDDATFVVSVGGFHPSFSPPPLPFPSPRRVSLSLINTDVARVTVSGYFAVTSNTAQFGAAVDMFFGFDSINVSGHLGFDALFQFSPFHFIITISASFSLNAFGMGLFSVSIQGTLEGPSPWHARGTGSISLLFFDISADFDVTWGESDNATLPPIEVMPAFLAEFQKLENWKASLPAGNNLLVTLRPLPPSDALVLHPVGVLRVAQRALPLELTLDVVGNQKPSDVNRLSIDRGPGGLAKKADAYEQFAPAQYQKFSDSEKLSRPAYAPEIAGLELSAAGSDLTSSKMVKRFIRYEQILIDSRFSRVVNLFATFAIGLFMHFLGGASVTKSELSQAAKKRFDPFEAKIDVQAETFTVALQSNNRAYTNASASFHSEASAREYMNNQIKNDPNLANTLHVIPSYEKAA